MSEMSGRGSGGLGRLETERKGRSSPVLETDGVSGLGRRGSGAGGGGTAGTSGFVRPPPSSPGVKAGAADDNLAFNAFLSFVEEHGKLGLRHSIADRIRLSVKDRDGRPVPGAKVFVDGVLRRTTHPDGTALLHPERWGVASQADVRVEGSGGDVSISLGAARSRRLDLRLQGPRVVPDPVPVDVAFVIDTTGSMGDEIQRLKDTLGVITYQISRMRPQPILRLGMVLFRDEGDDYVTRVVPFTADLHRFEAELRGVTAGGGGDYPEDVQAGLKASLHDLKWREEGVRLAFLVGDAPPHIDYGQQFTYLDAAEEAARRGIKITAIGASGLDRAGELAWRQIAQATSAPFVFLTYGEKGDSEGSPSTVSHHVGSNWVAADLDAIIVRMVKLELSHFSPTGLEPQVDHFSAAPDPARSKDAVLDELFERAMKQIVDYAVEPLGRATPTVVLPLDVRLADAATAKSRIERRVALGLSRKPEFRLVEAAAKAELLETLAKQLSLAHEEGKTVTPGRMLPAELVVLGRLDGGRAGELELLLELVRLETGEILSLSLLRIERSLLL